MNDRKCINLKLDIQLDLYDCPEFDLGQFAKKVEVLLERCDDGRHCFESEAIRRSLGALVRQAIKEGVYQEMRKKYPDEMVYDDKGGGTQRALLEAWAVAPKLHAHVDDFCVTAEGPEPVKMVVFARKVAKSHLPEERVILRAPYLSQTFPWGDYGVARHQAEEWARRNGYFIRETVYENVEQEKS